MDYEHVYFLLFNAITDAISALRAWNLGQAETILKNAQQAAEEEIICQAEQ